MKNYPLYIISLCFAGGILLQFLAPLPISVLILCGIISAFLLITAGFISDRALLPHPFFGISSFILFVVLGMFTTYIHQPENSPSHYIHSPGNVEIPIRIKITEQLKSSDFQSKYLAEVLQIDKQPVTGKILLNIARDSSLSILEIGNNYLLFSKIQNVQSPRNPYQFDYSNYLKNLRVNGQITVSNIEIFAENSGNSLRKIAGNVRSKIISNLKNSGIAPAELGIIQALILGQRQELSKEISGNFAAAGVMHILAVSGLHIGILLLLLQLLFKPLLRWKYGSKISLLLIIFCLWIYAFITGFSPSVLRAVTMFSFLAVGLSFKRKTSALNSLCTSLLVLLLFNPFLILQAGFQLSFLAVFSILLFHPIFREVWQPKYKFQRYFRDLVSISFAAQLGVLPLSIYYFHQFPALFFVSNLVILPFTGFLMAGGLLLSILAIADILPNFLAQLYASFISILENFVSFMASLENLIFRDIYISIIFCIIAYVLNFTFYQFLKYRTFYFGKIFLSSIILLQLLAIIENIPANDSEMVIFHQTGKSFISIADKGSTFSFSSEKMEIPPMVKTYSNYKNLENTEAKDLPNALIFHHKNILIIDSLGIYSVPGFKPDILILTQSPKINLDRIIGENVPELIIADGSNYKTYATRWEHTLAQRKIPFHNTSEKGSYILK